MKTLFSLLTLVASVTAAVPAAAAAAETTQHYSSGFRLGAGETRSLYLGGWRRVNKIIVQADGTWSSSMVEVYANGDVKGSLFVPGRDPSYVVTIAETTSTLEFRNLGNAAVNIRSVAVISVGDAFNDVGRPGSANRNRIPTSPEELRFSSELSLVARRQSTALASRAIELVMALEPFTNHQSYGTYLLPVKKVGARAYAVARANSEGSVRVAQALSALVAQIEFATPCIEDAFEREEAFEYATELLSLKETIQSHLR